MHVASSGRDILYGIDTNLDSKPWLVNERMKSFTVLNLPCIAACVKQPWEPIPVGIR